ncbi:MAG: insulinase family protein [Myxococcota bacterium]
MWTWLAMMTAGAAPHTYVAPDGLQVVIDARTDSNLVSVAHVVAVGSIDDATPDTETAHIAEHLWFRVALENGANVANSLAAWGCSFQGTTYLDQTAFYSACPNAMGSALLDLTDRFFTRGLADLPKTAVPLAQTVVFREYVQRRSGGVAGVQALWRQLAGSFDESKGTTAAPQDRDGIVAWAKEHWARSRATVAVVGGVDEAALVQRWSLTKAVPKARRSASVPQPRAAEIAVTSANPKIFLAWNWPDPPPDVAVVDAVVERALDERLRPTPGYRGTHCKTGLVRGLNQALSCVIEVQSEALPELRAEALDVIRKPFGSGKRATVADRLRRSLAREGAKRATLRDEDQAGRRAQMLAKAVQAGETTLDRTSAPSTVKDLVAYVRMWLTPGRAHSLLVRPKKEFVVPLPAADAGEATPAPTKPVALPALPGERETLDNGLNVVIVHQPNAQAERVSVVVHGGTARAPFGLTHYAEAWSRPALSRKPDGVLRETQLFADAVITRRAGPAGSLERVLEATRRDVVERVSYEWDTTDWVTDRQYQVLRDWSRSRWWAQRLRWNRIHPRHPALYEIGVEELAWMGRTPLNKARSYLQEVYRPGNLSLIVVTPSPTAEVRPRIQALFGRWTGSGKPREAAPPSPEASMEPGNFLFLEADGADAEVAVSCPLNASGPLAETIRALVFERLWSTLRVRDGLIYTPAVKRTTIEGGFGWLDVAVWVDPRSVPHARAELEHALRAPTEAEAQAAVRHVRNGWHRSLATASGVQQRWEAQVRLGPQAPPRESTTTPAVLDAALATCRDHRMLSVATPDNPQLSDLEPVDWQAHQASWLDRAKTTLRPTGF